jgi:ABC-type antimicrobial peptide transport system permease subunit
MTHGGKRPGAGAPKGNLNALKTGRRSKQLKAVISALLASPSVRRVMLALMKDDIRRRKEVKETIAAIALLADPRFQRSIKKITRDQIQKALNNGKQPVNQP